MRPYTQSELSPPVRGCTDGGKHEWLPEGNATYWLCQVCKSHTDMHMLDDDNTCLNCGEIHYKVENVAAERKAVIKVFGNPLYESWSEDEAADSIIDALNRVRENTKRFIVVANLKWDDDPNFYLWACGPFNTENQANAMGEKFSTDPATHRGRGRWRTVPILSPLASSPRTAWETIKPAHDEACCSLHHGWIKEDTGQWTWLRATDDTEHWREKVGW